MTCHSVRLRLEQLEQREMPSAFIIALENFDQTPLSSLPSNWLQWSSNGSSTFAVSNLKADSGSNSLATNVASSNVTARSWISTAFAADDGVQANVLADSLIPVQLFARGQNLNTSTPTYYAVTINRGVQIDLTRVVNGVSTSLGTLQSALYLTGKWLRVSMTFNGDQITVEVYRADTNQYLDSSGAWVAGETSALQVSDQAITAGGQVGVGRAARYAGTAFVDDFAVVGNTISENFNSTAIGSVPADWSRWSSDGALGFGASSARAVDGNALNSAGSSSRASRAWQATTSFVDINAAADVYVNSLIPAQVFVRGSNLDTQTPSYYAVSITRGLEISLIKVVDGVSTPLTTLGSNEYDTGLWINLSISVKGSELQARVQRLDTGEWLSSSGNWQSGTAAALDVTDSSITTPGLVGLGRSTSYSGDVAFDNFTAGPVVEHNNGGPTLPSIPSHYSHIRIAELAYSGNPMGAFEKQLLANSVDLVVPSNRYLATIEQTAPNTPKLIYSNISNLYLDLLTDWLNYADAHGVSRELAFYHVAQATAFSGASSSSQPVNWFWNVESGPTSGTTDYTNLTTPARNATAGDVPFGGSGQALDLGYTEQFREINFILSRGKQSGWSYVVEYPTATDAAGNPTAWKTLTINSDTTNGLSQSGRMTFDPPTDWVTAVLPGLSARLYYVRIRTIAGSAAEAPIATTILGRDYVNANGGSSGTIPAFDYTADTNHDGYLDDAEYANRAPGKDARFVYESRLFYPYYGQMRILTNPSSAIVQTWGTDFDQRLLAANPLADGIFMDNSSGKNPAAGLNLVESTTTYSADFAAMLGGINRAIAPKWVMANTSNGNAATDLVVRQVPATLEEFAVRALSGTWQQFTDMSDTVAHRQAVNSPSSYMVIDSLSRGGSPTDARTQMATLAEYYLIGNSKSTFLMLFGGEEPASTWSRHWFNAIATDVGQPKGAFTAFATGQDPANTALIYKVFARHYDNALVLYKPLSYALGKGTGTTADNTVTAHQLGGNYRVLNSDGTLGPIVTTITLRNGEGAVLMNA
jgi:hypothetical protein